MNECVATEHLEHITLTDGPAPEVDHLLASNRYGSYCIPRAFLRREVPTMLRAGQVYEPETLAFLRRHLGTGDIVTGGAFVGDFLPALHEVLAPGTLLHTFEPFPDSFDAAAYTCRLNGLDRVILHRCAVGAQASILPLAISRGAQKKSLAAGMHILRDEDDGERHEKISVPVLTIDALVPDTRRVSVLHLDVEGHETEALRGAARLLATNKPLVLLEGDRPANLREYIAALDALAPDAKYTFAGAIEKNAIFRPMAALA
ncbi:FkbM family methyltransferase [Thalassococcus sp. CAU 1522]|uniref:FkbM family methyltransferase n=1 Tax=Thalassococcus arenae TaxID=2851652 RepID=A0ABS6N682_9RHOB|nr:FkbM family methyltransferase [Thalassococcus arenae]MBV2359516.1 FkbM family methyltransferase [Thalassococcus arenae]